MACSWAKLPLILDAYQTWGRRHAKDTRLLHDVWWANRTISLSHHRHLRAETTARDGLPERTCGVESVKECFENDYLSFRQRWISDGRPPWCRFSYSSARDIHFLTRIPDSLLVGPWDDEMLRRLFWLLRAGARLSESQSVEVCFFNLVGLKSWANGRILDNSTGI